jgi:imidazolonepropionase
VSGSISIEHAGELLTVPATETGYLRHDRAAELALDPGSVTIAAGRVAALEVDTTADVRIDARGCTVLPGFVDCHTHLPFAGWRAEEYAQKVVGVPYEEIARGGGGIRASARALASAGDEEVLAQAEAIAGEMLRHGTTALECKTGYGLSVDAEARSARLAHALGERVPQATVLTGLIAHAAPDGLDADGWLDAIAPLAGQMGAVALDVYVESVAFTNDHLRRVAALAREHGLALRAHVEQFADHGSTAVAVAEGARSVDHLSCLPLDGVAALAASETAAVLLPSAELLGGERTPPARELADAGAICVLATDCNPGTSPVVSLPLVAGLAVRRYGWTVREALLALTQNAAYVMGLGDELGALEPGRRGDAIVLDCPAAHVPYRFGHNPVAAVVCDGELAWVRDDFAGRVRR